MQVHLLAGMRVRLSRSMCVDNWLLTVKYGLGAGNDELSALKCVNVCVCVCVVCLMTLTISMRVYKT